MSSLIITIIRKKHLKITCQRQIQTASQKCTPYIVYRLLLLSDRPVRGSV